MRTALSLLLVAGLAGSLAACASGGSPTESSSPSSASTAASSGCEAASAGAASDGIDVSGAFGEKPKVAFGTPLTVDATERTIVSQGEGEPIGEGETMTADFSLFNATSGEEIQSTGFDEKTLVTFTMDEAAFLPGFVKTLNCSSEGSRIVGVIPPADAFGEAGQAELEVAPTDSLVLVVDVVARQATRATGEDQAPQDGFPEVTLAEDGAPTVVIPDADPPTDLEIEVLKQGDGAKVADGDTVTVQYQGVNWTSKEVFDQSWGRAPAQFGTGDVIAGFGKAMVGQAVGSQVVVIIPPDEGYGEAGSEGAGIAGTDTLVFVIDILATS